jgi:hypothetical protein
MHEITPLAADDGVQVEARVRSNRVPLEVPCAIYVSVVPIVTDEASVPPGVEQEVVAPKVPAQTWKSVTLPRRTVSVAVAVTAWVPAVMIDVPAETP